MTVDSYSNLLALSGAQQQIGQPAKWTFLASLVLHLCLLTLVFGLRIAPKIERPLTTYHVSLVTLPSPSPLPAPAPSRPVEAEPAAPVAAPSPPSPAVSAPRTVEPVALSPAPATPQSTAPPRRQVKPAPLRMPKPTAPRVAPVPAFPPPQEAREVRRSFENPLKDALRGIELPPEAPKLGEIKPTPVAPGKAAPPPSQKDIQNILSNLKVPEAPPTPSPAAGAPEMPQPVQSRKSLSEDLAKRLQSIQQLRQPTPGTAIQPSLQANATGAKKPETVLRVEGVSPNKYLDRVQSLIGNQWIAPPVDLSGKSLRVVVRFRLDRTGNVSDIVIETSSGNGYYDDAGRRAVLKAGRLPSFPPEMTEPFLDTHFSFAVGEEAG